MANIVLNQDAKLTCYGTKTVLLMVFSGSYRDEGGKTVEVSAKSLNTYLCNHRVLHS